MFRRLLRRLSPFRRNENLLNELMMTESLMVEEKKLKNSNPSHQLNLNTESIRFTKRSLNEIAIDALIKEPAEGAWRKKKKSEIKICCYI